MSRIEAESERGAKEKESGTQTLEALRDSVRTTFLNLLESSEDLVSEREKWDWV